MHNNNSNCMKCLIMYVKRSHFFIIIKCVDEGVKNKPGRTPQIIAHQFANIKKSGSASANFDILQAETSRQLSLSLFLFSNDFSLPFHIIFIFLTLSSSCFIFLSFSDFLFLSLFPSFPFSFFSIYPTCVRTTDYLYIEKRKRNPVVFLQHYF